MPTVKISITANGEHYLTPSEMDVVNGTFGGDLKAYFNATHFHGQIACPWSTANILDAELVSVERK